MSDLGFRAFDEQVVLECNAARKGEELKSDAGLILGVRNQGDIPLYGTVVSVGENCPESIKELMGKDVALPQGSGIYSNVPDPRMAYGLIPRNSTEARIFVTLHYKGIRTIYDGKPQGKPVEQTEQPFKSSLTLLSR
ncbi:gp31 head assembly cochaperone with GroEL [Aeromonas phage Aeh1]|uniref:Gp31 head assembly cochaperone with GroEL n=1 Tax=Aeromonas phage Aeh1 TaxID=2880362 RepID=Q76YH0_9CAUD|nr:head morphogenesis [Aeromonas phage Aeh1]AAQ17925.1 gp31 head assembly cochaperone with GroEL [Aeromonas phage Aeh1]